MNRRIFMRVKKLDAYFHACPTGFWWVAALGSKSLYSVSQTVCFAVWNHTFSLGPSVSDSDPGFVQHTHTCVRHTHSLRFTWLNTKPALPVPALFWADREASIHRMTYHYDYTKSVTLDAQPDPSFQCVWADVSLLHSYLETAGT